MKSLQSVSTILGRFIKTKASKRTDDEILEGFGAEKDSSDEELKISHLKTSKDSSDDPGSTPKPKKSLFGRINKAASFAKSRMM